MDLPTLRGNQVPSYYAKRDSCLSMELTTTSSCSYFEGEGANLRFPTTTEKHIYFETLRRLLFLFLFLCAASTPTNMTIAVRHPLSSIPSFEAHSN